MKLTLTDDNYTLDVRDRGTLLMVDTGITVHWVLIPRVKRLSVSMYQSQVIVQIGSARHGIQLTMQPEEWQRIKLRVTAAALGC